MSNGVPESGAPYIIICNTRIAIATNALPELIILAASSGATTLSTLMETHYKAKPADLADISELQHEMMDNLHNYDRDGAVAVSREMVRLMYELEKRFI